MGVNEGQEKRDVLQEHIAATVERIEKSVRALEPAQFECVPRMLTDWQARAKDLAMRGEYRAAAEIRRCAAELKDRHVNNEIFDWTENEN